MTMRLSAAVRCGTLSPPTSFWTRHGWTRTHTASWQVWRGVFERHHPIGKEVTRRLEHNENLNDDPAGLLPQRDDDVHHVTDACWMQQLRTGQVWGTIPYVTDAAERNEDVGRRERDGLAERDAVEIGDMAKEARSREHRERRCRPG